MTIDVHRGLNMASLTLRDGHIFEVTSIMSILSHSVLVRDEIRAEYADALAILVIDTLHR